MECTLMPAPENDGQISRCQAHESRANIGPILGARKNLNLFATDLLCFSERLPTLRKNTSLQTVLGGFVDGQHDPTARMLALQLRDNLGCGVATVGFVRG